MPSRWPPFLERPGLGWAAWGAFTLALVAATLARPGHRRVDDVYHHAVREWWDARDFYGGGIHGYLYLPAFAPSFTPFTWLPRLAADAVWRILGLALLATGLFRLTGLARGPPRLFTLATLLALGAVWGSSRTGQTNTPLAGLFLHATVELVEDRRWRVAILLGIALLLKPIALAFLLVVAVLFPRVGWRLGIVVAGVLAVPFLHPDPAYVAGMYGSFVEKMRVASQPHILYDDLIGLLRTLGLDPSALRQVLPVAGAAGTLALSWLALRRFARVEGTVMVLALVATYLMLFNPRTETNSYVILSPVLALFAATALRDGRLGPAVALSAMTLALACDNVTLEIHLATDFWLKPLVALVFLGHLVVRVLGRAREAPAGEAGATPPPAV